MRVAGISDKKRVLVVPGSETRPCLIISLGLGSGSNTDSPAPSEDFSFVSSYHVTSTLPDRFWLVPD